MLRYSWMEELAMKHCTRFSTLLVAGILIIIVEGCQNKSDDTASSKSLVTIENLQTAYSSAKKRALWYSRFVQTADKEKLTNVALLFNAIARSEEIHAGNHAMLLRSRGIEPKEQPIDSVPMGVTRQSLKMSLSTESFECESLYPSMIRTAGVEKWSEVATQFKQTKDADARHAELLKQASDYGGNISRVTYYICPGCGYIVTSERTELCPICSTKNEKFVRM
jgi:rubrerythrin